MLVSPMRPTKNGTIAIFVKTLRLMKNKRNKMPHSSLLLTIFCQYLVPFAPLKYSNTCIKTSFFMILTVS